MKNYHGILQNHLKRIILIACHAFFYSSWCLRMVQGYQRFFRYFQDRYGSQEDFQFVEV